MRLNAHNADYGKLKYMNEKEELREAYRSSLGTPFVGAGIIGAAAQGADYVAARRELVDATEDVVLDVTYRIIRLGDAAKMGAPLPTWEGSWEDALAYDGDWDSGIWRCEDGVPVEFIGRDGGEPEDQTLVRDWAWVASALQAAYGLGCERRTLITES